MVGKPKRGRPVGSKNKIKRTNKKPCKRSNLNELSESQLSTRKKAFISALKSTLGIVTRAAEKSGIDRDCHYKWMREDAKYKEAVADLDNLVIDFAETSLMNQIKEGNTAATIFILKCRGKKRGYVERDPNASQEDGSNLASFLKAMQPPKGLFDPPAINDLTIQQQ